MALSISYRVGWALPPKWLLLGYECLLLVRMSQLAMVDVTAGRVVDKDMSTDQIPPLNFLKYLTFESQCFFFFLPEILRFIESYVLRVLMAFLDLVK